MSLKKIVKNIFSIIDRRERAGLGKLILFDVVISILDILFLAMLLFVIHFYVEGRHLTNSPYLPLSIFNKYPLLLIVVFFILFSLKNLAGFLVSRMQFKFIYSVASRLSRNGLSNYLDGSYDGYSHIDSSVHTRIINQEPTEFCHYVLGGFQQIISQGILILLTILATLIYNPILFLLIFAILTPPVALAGILLKKRMGILRKTAKPVSEKALQHLNEALSGFIESNVYERKGFFIDRYYRYQTKFNDFLANLQVIQSMPSKLIEVFAIFGFLILILINSYAANRSSVQLITIGAFMGAAYKIIPGIVKLLNSYGQIRTYGFTMTDLLKEQGEALKRPILEKGPGVEKAPDVKKVATDKMPDKMVVASVEFAGISFNYPGKPVLNDFSMTIARGEIVGLSGLSGKGKTTIVNLLLGFLSPSSGTIYVNGEGSDALQRQKYRESISYVKQQSFLIYDSILRNIVLDEGPYDADRLGEVIRTIGLEEFTGGLPDGLNKLITENGKNISGGQRQRIAFGRALYKDSALLILDEPFNELDEPAERKMLEHCRQLAQTGKAILLITHNENSLVFCDKIVSLDEP